MKVNAMLADTYNAHLRPKYGKRLSPKEAGQLDVAMRFEIVKFLYEKKSHTYTDRDIRTLYDLYLKFFGTDT